MRLNLLIILMLFICVAMAQKQGVNWYMGSGAAVTFEYGAPVDITGNSIQGSQSSSCISDNNGNLLFYSDGVTVWNRNNEIMPNGINLMGDVNSEQGAAIVKKPGQGSLYFVFTLDADGGSNGFRYSIVDMSLENGLGNVTSKNVFVQNAAADRIAIIPHSNQTDYWILVHDFTGISFKAYLLTEATFDPPVISNIGHSFSGFESGHMKISPDHSVLASVYSEQGSVEVFHFDNSNGEVSDNILIPGLSEPYGIEFSPDSRKMYATDLALQMIVQFDISDYSLPKIVASREFIGNSEFPLGGLQLGPDGRIYVATVQNSLLGVISNPEAEGLACAFVPDFLQLSSPCGKNLPVFPQIFEKQFSFFNTCLGDETVFVLNDSFDFDSVLWHFNDHQAGAENTSSVLMPNHQFSEPGTYTVELIVFSGGGYSIETRVITIEEYPVADFTISDVFCYGDDVNVEYSGISYSADFEWSFPGADIPESSSAGPITLNYSEPGDYMIQLLVSQRGCSSSFSQTVSYPEEIITGTQLESPVCFGDLTGNIYLSSTGGTGVHSYLWSTGTDQQSILNVSGGNYGVTITDENGCTISEIINLSQPSTPVEVEISITGFCEQNQGGWITANAAGGSGSYTFTWSDGTNENEIGPVFSGVYSVSVSDASGCLASDLIDLLEIPEALSAEASVNHVSCNGAADASVLLNISGGVEPYSVNWSSSQSGAIAEGLSAGSYQYTVTDERNCVIYSDVNITEPNPIEVFISGSPELCYGQSAKLDALITSGFGPFQYVWSNGETTSSINLIPDNGQTISVIAVGANNCYSTPAEMTFSVTPEINLSYQLEKEVVCIGDQNTVFISRQGGVGSMLTTVTLYGEIVENSLTIENVEEDDVILVTTDGCSAPSIDTIEIPVYDPRIISIMADQTNGCEPLEVTFNETGEGSLQSLIWSFGDGVTKESGNKSWTRHTYTDGGIYDVTVMVQDLNGCSYQLTEDNLIWVKDKPQASIEIDNPIVNIINPVVSFTAQFDQAYAIFWDFGDGTSASAAYYDHMYNAPGEYFVELMIVSEDGCTDTANTRVQVNDVSTFFAPTAFTPNNDGQNDEFYLVIGGALKGGFYMAVADRWGQIVFETKDLEIGWDGRDVSGRIQPTGVYTWITKYTDINSIEIQKTGSFTLVR